ncbi:TKL protein kinase, variant [Aphanomyces invadans]|uniref:TKL protein kinase, variant n=1 Tax=Aphanomyces invadans TaxID=157072 RepID=A0A024UAG9_9STRA|nr:TKL protein kinase, variant [Aphanomyces invadans]ETW03269.1 TKL protein kinase, variant [Aphanomyces invadans]|eukprot:XP_008867498.1 TKL protein kinase, variant [Aphanomyces invadans]
MDRSTVVRDYHYTDAISPYTDFDRLDDLHLDHDLSPLSFDDSMHHIVQVETARTLTGRRVPTTPTTARRQAIYASNNGETRWFPRRLFPKFSIWDTNVLWSALAALAIATTSMVTAGFILRRPSESSLGIHIACYAPGNDEAAVFLGDFRQSHAIVGAMVQLGTYAVLGVVSVYVGIQCSFSKQKVLANPNNSNLTSSFVLPCYGTIWYTMAALSIAEIAVIASSHVRYVQDSRGPYCILLNFPRMWIRHLVPLLMLQKSVSQRAVHRAIFLSGLLTAAVLSILTAPQSLSTVFIAYPFGLVLFCSFVKFVLHTRASFDVYWYFLLVLCTVHILPSMLWLAVTDASTPAAVVLLSISADILDGWTLAAIMLTLRVDTMYWLGLDTPSAKSHDPAKLYLRLIADQGMGSSFSTRTSVYDVHYLIEMFKHCMVDVSSLALEAVVAQGSTSVVLRGRLQHALREPEAVAIKLYTTWFVTDDEVCLFSKEAACNAQLSHPNIVRFYGLCVVPPSICLVFEFCDLGSLESILQAQRRTGDAWDLRTKLKACLDACRAVAYLHSFHPPLLHRDIKTANYLLSSSDNLLKLSDFGESNLLGPKNDGTMTVVGTVDFMVWIYYRRHLLRVRCDGLAV